MLEKLKTLNPTLNLSHVHEESFLTFGRVLDHFPFEEMERRMKDTEIPKSGNIYIPSVPKWEQGELKTYIERMYYGCMPIQIGYCNGKNSRLNGLEYHKGSEIAVPMNDLILLLGHLNDVKEGYFHVEDIHGFYIPKGTVVELYQTTLHLAPCKLTDEGFKCAIILPAGTNTPLTAEEKAEDKLLLMKNKWVISHPDNARFISQGAHVGLIGENITVHYSRPH